MIYRILRFPETTIVYGLSNIPKEFICIFDHMFGSYLDQCHAHHEYCDIIIWTDNKTYIAFFNATHALRRRESFSSLISLTLNEIITIKSNESSSLLHAGVCECNGKTIVLIGNKGAGKTTALLYLISKGGTYLGDELVVVNSKGIIPYCLPLRISAQSVNWMKSNYSSFLDSIALQHSISTDKYIIYPSDLKHRIISSAIIPDVLLFLVNDNKNINNYSSNNTLQSLFGHSRTIVSSTSILPLLNLSRTPAYYLPREDRFSTILRIIASH